MNSTEGLKDLKKADVRFWLSTYMSHYPPAQECRASYIRAKRPIACYEHAPAFNFQHFFQFCRQAINEKLGRPELQYLLEAAGFEPLLGAVKAIDDKRAQSSEYWGHPGAQPVRRKPQEEPPPPTREERIEHVRKRLGDYLAWVDAKGERLPNFYEEPISASMLTKHTPLKSLSGRVCFHINDFTAYVFSAHGEFISRVFVKDVLPSLGYEEQLIYAHEDRRFHARYWVPTV